MCEWEEEDKLTGWVWGCWRREREVVVGRGWRPPSQQTGPQTEVKARVVLMREWSAMAPVWAYGYVGTEVCSSAALVLLQRRPTVEYPNARSLSRRAQAGRGRSGARTRATLQHHCYSGAADLPGVLPLQSGGHAHLSFCPSAC